MLWCVCGYYRTVCVSSFSFLCGFCDSNSGLRSSGSHSRCFHPLTHLTGPDLHTFISIRVLVPSLLDYDGYKPLCRLGSSLTFACSCVLYSIRFFFPPNWEDGLGCCSLGTTHHGLGDRISSRLRAGQVGCDGCSGNLSNPLVSICPAQSYKPTASCLFYLGFQPGF